MKGTQVENEVKSLFEGQTISYIQCTDVDFGREHEEIFYDIHLPVKVGDDNPFLQPDPNQIDENDKGFITILEAFEEYIKPDKLDGDNKWDTGNDDHGKQNAEKGTKFKKFPMENAQRSFSM